MATVFLPDRNSGDRLAVSWGVGNVVAVTPAVTQVSINYISSDLLL